MSLSNHPASLLASPSLIQRCLSSPLDFAVVFQSHSSSLNTPPHPHSFLFLHKPHFLSLTSSQLALIPLHSLFCPLDPFLSQSQNIGGSLDLLKLPTC